MQVTGANPNIYGKVVYETANSYGSRNTGELGKNEFLNLLITQLRYQDPLKPVDDKEFIAQIAQFSALEQMQNVNASLMQSRAFSLLNKHVTASYFDESTGEARPMEGFVNSVKMGGGKVYVVVNGVDIPLDKVLEVMDGVERDSANLFKYANLIGFEADGCVYDFRSGDIVRVRGVVKSLLRGTYEDYAVMDDVEADVLVTIDGRNATDMEELEQYLEDRRGSEMSLTVLDRVSGAKVPVTAVVKDFSIEESGRVRAVLEGLKVPLDSIAGIRLRESDPVADE